jgi:hypothetical protein
MSRLKNQWIRSNMRDLVVISVMVNKTKSSVAILMLLLSTPVWANMNMVFSSTMTNWSMDLEETTCQVGISAMELSMGFYASAEMTDNNPVTIGINGVIAIAIKMPKFHFYFGDISRDPRLAVFSSTAFQLHPLKERDYGQVDVVKLDFDLLSHASWIFSMTNLNFTRIHLFRLVSQQERAGGNLGALVEIGNRLGIMRLATLVVDHGSYASGDHTINYKARAIGEGYSSYLAWSGDYEVADWSVSIMPQLLIRFACDRELGSAIASLYRLQIDRHNVSLVLERVESSAWVGVFDSNGTKIVDIPMRRDTVGLSYDGETFALDASLQDSWWQQTVYAAESQKRSIVASVAGNYQGSWGEAGIAARYRKRNNRSASQSKAIELSFPLSISMVAVELSFLPTLRWSKGFSLHGRLLCEFEIRGLGVCKTKLKIMSEKVDLDLTYIHELKGGDISVTLDSTGGLGISCSIDLGG